MTPKLLILGITGANVVAQAAGGDPAGIVEWLNFGIGGLIIFALIMGWLVPGRTFDREAQRGDRLEEKLDVLNDHMAEKVIPLLGRAVEALEQRAREEAS